jgi:hypothetical protein
MLKVVVSEKFEAATGRMMEGGRGRIRERDEARGKQEEEEEPAAAAARNKKKARTAGPANDRRHPPPVCCQEEDERWRGERIVVTTPPFAAGSCGNMRDPASSSSCSSRLFFSSSCSPSPTPPPRPPAPSPATPPREQQQPREQQPREQQQQQQQQLRAQLQQNVLQYVQQQVQLLQGQRKTADIGGSGYGGGGSCGNGCCGGGGGSSNGGGAACPLWQFAACAILDAHPTLNLFSWPFWSPPFVELPFVKPSADLFTPMPDAPADFSRQDVVLDADTAALLLDAEFVDEMCRFSLERALAEGPLNVMFFLYDTFKLPAAWRDWLMRSLTSMASNSHRIASASMLVADVYSRHRQYIQQPVVRCAVTALLDYYWSERLRIAYVSHGPGEFMVVLRKLHGKLFNPQQQPPPQQQQPQPQPQQPQPSHDDREWMFRVVRWAREHRKDLRSMRVAAMVLEHWSSAVSSERQSQLLSALLSPEPTKTVAV